MRQVPDMSKRILPDQSAFETKSRLAVQKKRLLPGRLGRVDGQEITQPRLPRLWKTRFERRKDLQGHLIGCPGKNTPPRC